MEQQKIEFWITKIKYKNKENVEPKFIKKIVGKKSEKILIDNIFFKELPIGIIDGKKINAIEKINEEKVIKKIKDKGNGIIFIILESPHKSEYKKDENGINAIAPAQGKTGKNLIEMVKTLENIVNSVMKGDEKKYEIIIFNPVPYQTSLHHLFIEEPKELNKAIRNLIWKKMWENNFNNCKLNLKEQIEKINPIVIFNCCTSDLKKYIIDELKNYKIDKKIFNELSHPSSPCFKSQLKLMEEFLLKKSD